MSALLVLIGRVAAWFEVEAHRAYLYRAAVVLGVVLVGLGRLTSGQLASDEVLLGAILGLSGTGLATAHSSTKAKP